MDTPLPAPELASLMHHAGFVRALARSLVRDEHEAADIEQEAWLAALRSPPRDAASAHSWFASVLRNLAGLQTRRAARRIERESSAARAERVDDDTRSLERLEMHERIVRAVLELREPYRGAIVACYFDGLSLDDAARRLGVPRETLKTRLRRALALLREDFDRRHGGRDAWLALALPLAGLARKPATAVAKTIGTLMGIKTWIAVSAAVLAATWWWTSKPASVPPSSTEVARAPVSAPESPASPQLDESGSQRAVVAPTSVETPAPSASAQPSAPAPEFWGTIVVVDELGREHADEDGSLTLYSVEGGPSVMWEVGVTHGRFVLPQAPEFELDTPAIVLGSRAAQLIEPARMQRRGEQHLRARWLPHAQLAVFDAASGAELGDVTVVRDMIAWRGQIHPGADFGAHLWRSHARSPIELPPVPITATYWVGAPGFGWKSVEVDHVSGGVRRVELGAGATLAITCSAPSVPPAMELRLFARDYDGGPSGQVSVAARAGEIVLEGLAPGAYELRAEIGMWYEQPHVFGRANVELRAGERESIALPLDLGEFGAATAAMSGELALPNEVYGADVQLRYEPLPGPALRPADQGVIKLDSMRSHGNGRFAWSTPEVTQGEYVFYVEPLQWWQVVDVGPRGASDVRIEVPELRRLILRAHEPGSSAALTHASVSWSRPWPAKTRVGHSGIAWFETASDGYVCVAPVGRMVVNIEEPDHERIGRSIEVGREPDTLDFELRALPSFLLGLIDGDVRVPVGWSLRFEVIAADGTTLDRRDNVGALAKYVANAPGRVVVRVPDIEGYEPVPELTVDVAYGPPQTLDVALRRREQR